MILKIRYDMGFLRHNSLNWNIFAIKLRGNLTLPLERIHSTLSNYAIPSEVAPQQSFGTLHVTVNTKMILLINCLTLSFPHTNE